MNFRSTSIRTVVMSLLGLVLITVQTQDVFARNEVEFKICVYDTKEEDGDRVNVEFDGENIFDNSTLSNKEECRSLRRKPKSYLLVIHALNTGERGPNTALFR